MEDGKSRTSLPCSGKRKNISGEKGGCSYQNDESNCVKPQLPFPDVLCSSPDIQSVLVSTQLGYICCFQFLRDGTLYAGTLLGKTQTVN